MRKNAPPTGETFFGGGGWIRTTEANRNRFTVCPLLATRELLRMNLLELVDGLEPPTG